MQYQTGQSAESKETDTENERSSGPDFLFEKESGPDFIRQQTGKGMGAELERNLFLAIYSAAETGASIH